MVILAWLVAVFLVVGVPQLVGWLDLSDVWTNPVTADLAVTALTVLPYLVYLVVSEAGPGRATLGKRRGGMVVSGRSGHKPATWRVVVRNLVKVLPWQLGHMGTMRLATVEQVTTSAMVLEVGSLALLAAVVVPILLGRRGVHDLAAGTRVVVA